MTPKDYFWVIEDVEMEWPVCDSCGEELDENNFVLVIADGEIKRYCRKEICNL